MSTKEKAAEFLSVTLDEVVDLASSVKPLPPPLTFVPNSEPSVTNKRQNSHTRTKFGNPAITRIFRAAGACDRFDSDVGNYLFLTATLPGDTDEAKWSIAEYAHIVIDRLKSWLSKRLKDRKEFYVWENQKRGALHFHYCLYCPDKAVQAEISKNFKREMVRLYDGIGKERNCDLWGRWRDKTVRYRTAILQARVEVVYKSVASYMAGYFSDGRNKHGNDANYPYYPRRWFGVSRPLSALVKDYTDLETYEFNSLKDCLELMHEIREELLDNALTYKDFKHKVGEGKTHASYHEQKTQKELWNVRKMHIHSQASHPVISSYVSLALKTTQELQQCLQSCRSLRVQLPLNCVFYFQDSTSQISMKNGCLSKTSIRMLETVFSSYDFSLDLRPAIKNCFVSLRLFNLLTARYYPQMRFSASGLLTNERDFQKPIDECPPLPYAGTSTEIRSDACRVMASSGLVPRDAALSYIQPPLW